MNKSFQIVAYLFSHLLICRVEGFSNTYNSFSHNILSRENNNHNTPLHNSQNEDNSQVEEYRNAATGFLSNFMSDKKEMSGDNKDDDKTKEDPLADIQFDAPKLSTPLDLETLAAVLDAELYDKEWFVTGRVNPIYFADDFRFQDPDVKLTGIEAYARGVTRIFDSTSRAEIISTKVNPAVGENKITCTWRLSGTAKIGPGITIKPYIVYTDFTVNPESGLVEFQEDRFDIPSWDILLSAFFPFLIGKVTSPPAPPVEPRTVVMPNISNKINRKLDFNKPDWAFW